MTILTEPTRSPMPRPNKKIPVFRVTRPFLVLLVKPIFFFRLYGGINLKGLEKNYNFTHLEG